MKLYLYFCLVFGALSILACSSKPIQLDPQQNVPWTEDLEKTAPHPAPYLALFKNKGKRLYYLAAHHDNQVQSPTFKLVRQAFEDYNVKAVMIEGVFASMGESPFAVLKTASVTWEDDFVGDGESGYAAVLATTREIPFFGGEPDDLDVYQAMLAEKYSPEDMVGYYLVRQYPQWVRQKRLEKKSLEKTASEFIAYTCQQFSIPSVNCTTYEKFKLWYKEKNKKDFPKNFDKEEAAPYSHGRYFTQRISHRVGRFRDAFIVKQIATHLNTHKNVLIVYGASHLLTQLPALQKGLGQPEYVTLKP